VGPKLEGDISYLPIKNKKEVGPSGYGLKMALKYIRSKEMEESGSGMSRRDRAKEHIKPFLSEYQSLGHSKQAIRNFSHQLPHFLCFLKYRGLNDSDISLQVAYDYQEYLILRGRRDGKPYEASTVRSYIKAASAYTAWLTKLGRLSTNPFGVMRKLPENRSLPKDLPKESELGCFLEGLSRFHRLPIFKARLRRYRTHIMMETLYATGLRLSELADLRVEDVDLVNARIFVTTGKGERSRYVFLTEYACRILAIYIKELRALIISYYPQVDKRRLFLSSPGTLVHTLNGDIKAASGVSWRLTVHQVRHTLGYHLLRAGCPLRYIQQILGHAHIRTSEIYTKVDGEKLGEMLSSCHPRSLAGSSGL